jgi:hypothetical protein
MERYKAPFFVQKNSQKQNCQEDRKVDWRETNEKISNLCHLPLYGGSEGQKAETDKRSFLRELSWAGF